MAKGINKVIIVGNLGQDPETRSFPDGGAITNISIATSESWKDKQTGQQQERTEWHKVVFRNRLAEIAAQYLTKGSKVYIEGSLRTRKWQNQQGVDQYTTEIHAREMQMLDSRAESSGGGNINGAAPAQDFRGHGGSNQQNPTYGAAKQGFKSQSPAAPPAPAHDDFDDDIPF